MKPGKSGPSFFEVLRSSAVVPKAVEAEEALETPIEAPPEPPVAAEPPSANPTPVAEAFEPDTRGLRLSYTAAVFVALVGVLLMLGSFYCGVQMGKQSSDAAAPAARVQEDPPAPTLNPSSRPALYTIKLLEYPARSTQERRQAQENAAKLKEALARANFKDALVVLPPEKVVLAYGRFADRGADARKTLDALRNFKYDGRQHFARADFVPAE